MIFFTSDFHLFHKNVLRFDDRPFKHIHEMHNTIISNWNEVVDWKDTVYYLGDLTFGGTGATKEILHALKGDIVYIRGNHDKGIEKYEKRFKGIYDYFHLALNRQRYVMFHYPILSFPGIHRGSIHLHGHCHQNLNPIFNRKGEEIIQKRLDVGCMGHNYYPISLEQVHKLVDKITNVPIDHHEVKESE